MNKLIPITTLTALIAFGPSLMAQSSNQGSMRNSDSQNQPNPTQQQRSNMGDQRTNTNRPDQSSSQWKSSSEKDHMGRSHSEKGKMRVTQASELMGQDLFDSQGRKVGDISDFVVNLQDGSISHVVVASGSWFDLGMTGEDRLVPIQAIDRQGDRFTLDITKQQFLETPTFDGELADIGQDVQQQLQSAYASSRAQIEDQMARADRPNSANQSRQAGDRQRDTGMASNQGTDRSDRMESRDSRDTNQVNRDRSPIGSSSISNSGMNLDGSGVAMAPNTTTTTTSSTDMQSEERDRTQNRNWQQDSGSFTAQSHVLFSEINESEVRSSSDDAEIAQVTDALINMEEGKIVYLLVDEDEVFTADYPNDVVALPMQAYSSRDGDSLVFDFSREQLRDAEPVEDVPSVQARGGTYTDAYLIRTLN